MNQTPVHDRMRPRLIAVLAEAQQAGISRDVALAVLTDLLEERSINDTEPPRE